MADKLFTQRNTRGFFEIIDSDGKIHKDFKDCVYTTEKAADIAIMKYDQASVKAEVSED